MITPDNGSKEYVTTEHGNLVIRTKAVKTYYSIYYANRTVADDEVNVSIEKEDVHMNDYEIIRAKDLKSKLDKDDLVIIEEQHYQKNYTSGMVMSWNKFCFTGGLLEMSIQLPGNENAGRLWPAAWLMGNLARATFDKSTLVSRLNLLIFHNLSYLMNFCSTYGHGVTTNVMAKSRI